ncbi:hypothetical protein THIX_20518 [Thiomonas sp. X19]|nr:hypothetical protein THIX_20518 [Thiomonas sp. X19]
MRVAVRGHLAQHQAYAQRHRLAPLSLCHTKVAATKQTELPAAPSAATTHGS